MLKIGFILIVGWVMFSSALPQPAPTSLLSVPDTARIDNSVLKEAGADKFLSLWFIYVLSQPVHTSSDPWTLFVPQNTGIPRGAAGFLTDRSATRRILVNHAVLGARLDEAHPDSSLTSLAGQTLQISKDKGKLLVNGIPVIGKGIDMGVGIVYVVEEYLVPGPPLPKSPEEGTEETPKPTASKAPQELTNPTSKAPRFRALEKNSVPGIKAIVEEPKKEIIEEEILVEEPKIELIEIGLGTNVHNLKGSFLSTLMKVLEFEGAGTAEFVNHLGEVDLVPYFKEGRKYTALVPLDEAFYRFYPIDWGFNPFLVENFTKQVLLDHFVEGEIKLEALSSGTSFRTLAGRDVTLQMRDGQQFIDNATVIFESETPFSGGRLYFLRQLVGVTNERVEELRLENGNLETGPLLGAPWPTSQFLSHLVQRLGEYDDTQIFGAFLNASNVAGFAPDMDEKFNRILYTAFIPTDAAIRAVLTAEDQEILLQDDELRSLFVLGHLSRGRYYVANLTETVEPLEITTLDNLTHAVTQTPDGGLTMGGVQLTEGDIFLYNLGNIFLIDSVLGLDEAPVTEFPIETTTKVASTTPPPTTTKSPTTTSQSATVPETTSSSPVSTQSPSTTPKIRIETRTEISVSRQINDGVVEDIPLSKALKN